MRVTARLAAFVLLSFVLARATVSAMPEPVAKMTVTIKQAQTVTLAWDASVTSTVTGYKIHYGTAPGVYSVHTDVGNVTQWTTPTLQPATYYFVATAYDPSAESGPSNEVSAALGTIIDPQPTDCLLPLGFHAVSVFVTKMEMTTGAVGSKARLNYQLGSPNSPILTVAISVGPSVVAKQTGTAGVTDLTASGGMWFTTPTVAGTYPTSISATNAAGCTTTVSKDALGNALGFTVK